MTQAQQPDELFGLSTLAELGYGHRDLIARRIRAGEVPAVRVGNRYKVRSSDLHLLARPVVASRSKSDDSAPDAFRVFIESLTDEQRGALCQLASGSP